MVKVYESEIVLSWELSQLVTYTEGTRIENKLRSRNSQKIVVHVI